MDENNNDGVVVSDVVVKAKIGRPKGSKDLKPRKPRSDKGIPRKRITPDQATE